MAGHRITVAIDDDAKLAIDPDGAHDGRLVRQRMQGVELFLGEEFLGRLLGLTVDRTLATVSSQ